jgi:putative toxin-antitoxin system antitoxin component (TIGR02293 family)
VSDEYTKNMTQSLSRTRPITYTSIQHLSDEYQINRLQVRNILGISESTQFRYEKRNPLLKPNLVDRWLRFEKIVQQAQELFENQIETQRWLSTPKVALENKTPLEILDTDSGCRQVEQILLQAAYGVFA